MNLRPLLAAAALVVAACSSRASAPTATPVATASSAVSAFLEAAADSNLTRMGALWGTTRGPASETRQPADWQRRVLVMQAYLRRTTHRVVAEDRGSSDAQRTVHVELRRDECVYMVPFTSVRSNRGWLVNAFDLDLLGVPGRPGCGTGTRE